MEYEFRTWSIHDRYFRDIYNFPIRVGCTDAIHALKYTFAWRMYLAVRAIFSLAAGLILSKEVLHDGEFYFLKHRLPNLLNL